MHSQDAYIVETGAVGTTFAAIAYDIPASKVFKYTYENSNTWTATPQDLPNCSTAWTVKSEVGSNKTGKHTAKAGCSDLTPNFTQIGAGTL